MKEAQNAPSKDETFHRSRRMFCIKDDCLEIAPANTSWSHFEWFKDEGWINESTTGAFFNKTIRGFYTPQNNTLYTYTGNQGFHFNNEVISVLKTHLKGLEGALGLNQNTNICFGPKDRVIGGTTWAQLCIGTLSTLV